MVTWKINSVFLSSDESQIVGANYEVVCSMSHKWGAATVSPQALDVSEADLITATKAALGSDQVAALETEPDTSSRNLHRAFPILTAAQDAAKVVRNKRNALLIETDYLALSDTTLSSDMAVYRQALRDITSQAGFPANLTWPTKP